MKEGNLYKKIKDLWKKNQEEGSDRFIEREKFKEELGEYEKDVLTIINSPLFKINDKPLEKAILIQNLHAQRNLNKATDSLKTATWVLAIATGIFAWATIIDSKNSSYFIQTLQNIVGIIAGVLVILIAVAVVLKILKFFIKK